MISNNKNSLNITNEDISNHGIPNPHGGRLVNRVIDNFDNDDDIKDFFKINVNDDLRNDIENIADGIFSPLEGFVNEEDFVSILRSGRLKNGIPWTIPIILDVDKNTSLKIKDCKEILLSNNNEDFAILHYDDNYKLDKKISSELLYKTNDISHPGVFKMMHTQDYAVAGKIDLIKRVYPSPIRSRRLNPTQTRNAILKKGWKTIVGFQTRNIPHIAHEMLQKASLNLFDGLFINPLIGKKKSGDFRDDVILRTYEELIKLYYPDSRVLFVTLHTEMRYGGPKEAIHHAIMRKNFGCSHFIVGRDHAGVGNFYHPFAAHEIFKEYPDLGIQPIFFPAFYYCKKCLSYANERNCPHGNEFKEELSGTRMRQMISTGEIPSENLMRPEIAKVILGFQKPFID